MEEEALVDLEFLVCNKTVRASLYFDNGDDYTEAVRKFMTQEGIPVFLEVPILASLHALFKEEGRILPLESRGGENVHVVN